MTLNTTRLKVPHICSTSSPESKILVLFAIRIARFEDKIWFSYLVQWCIWNSQKKVQTRRSNFKDARQYSCENLWEENPVERWNNMNVVGMMGIVFWTFAPTEVYVEEKEIFFFERLTEFQVRFLEVAFRSFCSHRAHIKENENKRPRGLDALLGHLLVKEYQKCKNFCPFGSTISRFRDTTCTRSVKIRIAPNDPKLNLKT